MLAPAPTLTPPASVPETTTTAAPDVAPEAPASKPADDEKRDEPAKAGGPDTTAASSDEGLKPAVVPKPVEVNSVPETPVNNHTPVGGTPRPDLKISEEDKAAAEKQADSDSVAFSVPNGAGDATAHPAPEEPVTELPSGAGPEKRKAEDEAAPEANGDAAGTAAGEERPEKKAKLTDKFAERVAEIKDKVESKIGGGGGAKGKGGRPKKDKTNPPPVGRTERKTRSQGPVA